MRKSRRSLRAGPLERSVVNSPCPARRTLRLEPHLICAVFPDICKKFTRAVQEFLCNAFSPLYYKHRLCRIKRQNRRPRVFPPEGAVFEAAHRLRTGAYGFPSRTSRMTSPFVFALPSYLHFFPARHALTTIISHLLLQAIPPLFPAHEDHLSVTTVTPIPPSPYSPSRCFAT